MEIQEKVVTIKGETLTVFKDRIVTVTKVVRPDGTVEETTRTEEKEGKKENTYTLEVEKMTNYGSRRA